MANPNVAHWGPLVAKVLAHQRKLHPGRKSPVSVPQALGLIEHESQGDEGAVNPSSGAFELTQFLPSTARTYGVKKGDARSAIRGMVRYLYDLHGDQDLRDALDHHYGGAGADGYLNSINQRAKGYKKYSGLSYKNGKGAGRPSRGSSGPRSVTAKVHVPGVDNSATRQSYLLNYLSERGKPGALLDLAGELKSAQDVPGRTVSKTVKVPSSSPSSKYKAAPAGKTMGQGFYFKHPGQTTKIHGTTNFEGHTVAGWIRPALVYARRHGWTGSINSGFRSFAEQQRIYNSGVRPAAVPGTSNHEGADFPRGAVDVSNASQLSSILSKSPYAHLLVFAGAKDPVHFSHPHGGSY